MNDDVQQMITRIEERQGALEPEDKEAIELWAKGRELAQLVHLGGWQTVLEMLQSYALKAQHDLVNLAPGDNDRILAAHALAYGLTQRHQLFVEDVANAVEAARDTPSAMRGKTVSSF